MVNEQKTLLFAPFSGGPVLRNHPPDRYVINFRVGYAEETAAMLDALSEIAGLKPEEIAFFTQRDSYGDAGFTLGMAALQRHGLRDPRTVLHVGYERSTLAVEKQALAWRSQYDVGPEALQKLRTAVQEGNPYGLALLDIRMPGMDGLTLARAIKAQPSPALGLWP